ncbi:DUF885 domain-containing protein [Sphingomonas hankyongi]|uniref:DUF885 domain-containing protein n=1 Tax=Sphingomonas hankyongi TaxID=2908209 RepID=A0ABT0S2T3_9SPHN|nr:DUF885 domain-containing protein [Sphingomonas hankyongi]MCL6729906.1 DUF885 domain-containing protein [Sphingomonas hankyongi]
MRRLTFAFCTAASLAVSTPVLAGPVEDFHKLMDDYWATQLKESPLLASRAGVHDYDAQLDEVGVAALDRQAREAADFLKRLNAIPAAALTPADQTNDAILRRSLESAVEANRFGQRMIFYSSNGSLHNYLVDAVTSVSLRTRSDYENYLTRLSLVKSRLDAYGAMSAEAARKGYAQPCVTVTSLPQSISGVVAADPAKSRFYEPFAAARPAAIEAGDWAAMQARARDVIATQINPAYTNLGTAFGRDILPRCLKDISVSGMPQGKEYYAYLVRNYTTTDLTPDQIHDLGLKEVARIRAEMDDVAHKAGFATREAMIADMRTNPKYFAKTPEELLAATALMAKTIDGKMPGLFGKLPRLPYGIKPIPAETAEGNTTAYYQDGSPDAGRAGTYFVNTTHLDQRPLWELPPLTVHEAVPGHHNQISLQQELDLPEWRKYGTFFTAFVEGWGLYSERLGIEMGIYDTPQKNMGRIGYEMWRAARLVVDTGMHSKGWSKERAVAFMKDNTTLTDANIDAEVNRYISTPGQALAYKLGELKIRELRTRAEQELGPKFDLRRFHDAVLGQGAVPLDTLEAQINAWIVSEKARN